MLDILRKVFLNPVASEKCYPIAKYFLEVDEKTRLSYDCWNSYQLVTDEEIEAMGGKGTVVVLEAGMGYQYLLENMFPIAETGEDVKDLSEFLPLAQRLQEIMRSN